MIRLTEAECQKFSLNDLAPDLTPLLDILFILLVFFLLTAGVVLKVLDVKLPTGVTETLPVPDQSDHNMLAIRQQEYVLNGKVYPAFDALCAAVPGVIKDRADYQLFIATDKRIPVEKLLRVLTCLQSQGIEAANILMQKEGES